MATEYTLYSAAELSTDELLAFLAGAVDGSVTPYGYVDREGLQVSALAEPESEQAEMAEVFGFTHRVTAIFRFDNLAPPEVKETDTVLMIGATLQLFRKYRADGVLLLNGEEVVVQRLNGEVSLNGDWEDFAEIEGLKQIATMYPLRTVPQPLL
jgi:hypothetical protein